MSAFQMILISIHIIISSQISNHRGRMKVNILIWKIIFALAIVVVSFLASRWLAYDFLSISYFAPMEKASDFQVSDFYNIVADGREVRTLDSSIVLVNIDGCSRDQIADAVEQTDFCGPRAIGLDVFFDYPGSDDSRLVSVMSECGNLVLPLNVLYNDAGKAEGISGSFFYDSLPDGRLYGAVNLAGNDARSVIRQFRPFFTVDRDTIFNFVVQLAFKADPEAAGYLLDRGKSLENIYYPSREFEIINAEDILQSRDILRDKTVLIGTLNDFSDEHMTPTESAMPGVLIQAHTLATILHRDYVRETGKAVDWSIAFILCFLVVFVNLWLWPYDFGALLVRLLQMLMLYLIVLAGCRLFISRHICVNFSFPLLMVGIGLMVTDILMGIVSSGRILYSRSRQIYSRHKRRKK